MQVFAYLHCSFKFCKLSELKKALIGGGAQISIDRERVIDSSKEEMQKPDVYLLVPLSYKVGRMSFFYCRPILDIWEVCLVISNSRLVEKPHDAPMAGDSPMIEMVVSPVREVVDSLVRDCHLREVIDLTSVLSQEVVDMTRSVSRAVDDIEQDCLLQR